MVIGFVTHRLVSLLIGTVVLIVLLFLGAGLALNRIVKTGIEKVGPLVVGVPLTLDDVDISLLGGSFALQGFEVGNPEGFDSPRAAHVGRMRVDAELRTLLSDVVVIPLVEVARPELTVEFSGGTTNFGRILKGMKSKEKEARERTDRRLRIGTLRIEQPSVRLANLPGGRAMSVDLPGIELTDLSAGGGASPYEVALQIIRALNEAVLEAAKEQLGTRQLEDLTEQAEEAGRGVLREGAEGLKTRLKDLLD